MKIKLSLLLLALLLIQTTGFSKEEVGKKADDKKPGVIGALFTPDPDQILGEILKGVLQRYHLTQKEVNDDLSEKAYQVYLEQIDYGKQFLTKDDLKSLKKQKYEFDDQLISGDLSIVKTTSKIFDERIYKLHRRLYLI